MTQQVIAELDALVALLEARIPANPASAENARLAKQLEKVMATYFQGLEKAFPWHLLDTIYNKNVVKEVIATPPPFEGDEFLDTLINAFRADLLYRLNGHLATIYLSGSAQMISWGKTKLLGLPKLFEGPSMKDAVDFAREHCAQMVTKMDEETKTRLAKVISDGIDNKRGVEGIARDLRKEFTDMSKYRSELISQNETADALQQAFMDRADGMGIEAKEWITTGDERVCEICDGNAADGIIPLHQPFSSGDMRPPGHPGNCRCALAPAMLPKE
jgi:SPP1 gp7 family putative phage head morphogenesis protein